MFNPIVELAIPIGMPTTEAKAEMETHPVTHVSYSLIHSSIKFLISSSFFSLNT